MPARPSAAKDGPRTPRSARLYLALGAVVLLLLFFEARVSSLPFAEAVLPKLSDFQLKELETYIETNKLLTSLATLTIGATTGFLVSLSRSTGLAARQAGKAVASWILAGISLYCGHLAYGQVMWMLDNKFFNLFYPRIWWPTHAQFWTFLFSVIVLADFVYGSIGRSERAAAGAGT